MYIWPFNINLKFTSETNACILKAHSIDVLYTLDSASDYSAIQKSKP
jgi:hypothetical protein